jgi:quinol monooxygenase YgiN
MIAFIAHVRVRPENAAAFEAAVGEMCAQVRENEPGALYYGFARSDDDPSTYVVLEVFRDQAAHDAHQQQPYVQPSIAKTMPLVESGSFDLKRYQGP